MKVKTLLHQQLTILMKVENHQQLLHQQLTILMKVKTLLHQQLTILMKVKTITSPTIDNINEG